MSMTAAELFEIMRDVPREAWGELDWYCGEFVKKHTYDVVESDVAEHAFIGSMTAWLLRQEWRGLGRGHLLIDELDDGDVAIDMQYVELDGITETYRICDMHASSLVAALAAACKEAA